MLQRCCYSWSCFCISFVVAAIGFGAAIGVSLADACARVGCGSVCDAAIDLVLLGFVLLGFV